MRLVTFPHPLRVTQFVLDPLFQYPENRTQLLFDFSKVEALFYESKIRVNGKKLLKKSAHLDVGDEIDVVRGVSPTNPDHLIVSRVEILAAYPKSETIGVSLRRQKTLIIEDYETDAVLDK